MAGSSLDWSLVRVFLAVAEHGSLSAAARVLGATQPTVGRQIRAIEDQLGAELFHRRDKGLVLTATGEALLEPARTMRRAGHAIELGAAGKEVRLEGTVRVTASIVVASHHLPPIIARLRRDEPQIGIELDVSDASSNLHFREADIAVRMYRPTQLDLVTLLLGEVAFAAFAAPSYLERRGVPETAEDLLAHEVIGMDRQRAIGDGFRAAGFPVEHEWFKVRCDDPNASWELVRAGCGIGFAQVALGRRDPGVVELALPLALPRLPVWLTAHEAVRRVPRVARVWDALAAGLREIVEPA